MIAISGAVPNSLPYVAMYVRQDEDGIRWMYKPVVAWSEDGRPIVVDETGKRLTFPENIPHYTRLKYAPQEEDGDGRPLGVPEEMEIWISDEPRGNE